MRRPFASALTKRSTQLKIKESKTTADLIVRLEGLKLSKEAEAAINLEVQATVLREIARYDFGTDFTVRIPRKEWLRIWIRNQAFEGNIKLQVTERQ